MLDKRVPAVVRLIPGVDGASFTVVIGRRQVTSPHPTGDLRRHVDQEQTEVGQALAWTPGTSTGLSRLGHGRGAALAGLRAPNRRARAGSMLWSGGTCRTITSAR